MTNCGKGPNAIKFANNFFDFDIFILQTKRSAHQPTQSQIRVWFWDTNICLRTTQATCIYILRKKEAELSNWFLISFFLNFQIKKNIPKFVHLDIILDK